MVRCVVLQSTSHLARSDLSYCSTLCTFMARTSGSSVAPETQRTTLKTQSFATLCPSAMTQQTMLPSASKRTTLGHGSFTGTSAPSLCFLSDAPASHIDWHLNTGLGVIMAESLTEVASHVSVNCALTHVVIQTLITNPYYQQTGMHCARRTTTLLRPIPPFRPFIGPFSLSRSPSLGLFLRSESSVTATHSTSYSSVLQFV